YSYFWPAGAPKDQQNTIMADYRAILPGYFKSMGVTFLAGRDFDEHDVDENLHLAIIDDTVAEQSWPGQQAVGKVLNVENGTRDKDLPIYHLEFMTEYVESARRQAHFVTLLAVLMAGIALLLASTGIYAVTRYSVVQRTSELGIRTALGAEAAQLFGLVVRQS